jgi:alpha-D-ribose 1-methylphosphonate 5-triphosphate synthase subunit PhnH
MITDFSTAGSAGLKHCNNGTVEKPKSASVPLLIRLKTFTQGQIIITHQVSPIIVIGKILLQLPM